MLSLLNARWPESQRARAAAGPSVRPAQEHTHTQQLNRDATRQRGHGVMSQGEKDPPHGFLVPALLAHWVFPALGGHQEQSVLSSQGRGKAPQRMLDLNCFTQLLAGAARPARRPGPVLARTSAPPLTAHWQIRGAGGNTRAKLGTLKQGTTTALSSRPPQDGRQTRRFETRSQLRTAQTVVSDGR